MQAAAEMRHISIATGDQAYGAIIVMAGRIVGLGVSKVVVNRDPSAHAEMEAIRDACRRLGTADLSGSTMFSTSRAVLHVRDGRGLCACQPDGLRRRSHRRRRAAHLRLVSAAPS